MENLQPAQEFLYWLYGDMIRAISYYFPVVLGALLILIFGAALARILASAVVRILRGLRLSNLVKDTPIDLFLQKAEIFKIESVVGKIVYWLLMLVVIHSAVSVLGLDSLTLIFSRVLAYIPKVISAIVILFVGLLLAGVVESLVKASIRSIEGKQSLLLGKVSSYLVMGMVTLAAISELGIASDFILVLFIGLIFTISLGVGLAIGLGAKDIVKKRFEGWYEKIKED